MMALLSPLERMHLHLEYHCKMGKAGQILFIINLQFLSNSLQHHQAKGKHYQLTTLALLLRTPHLCSVILYHQDMMGDTKL